MIIEMKPLTVKKGDEQKQNKLTKEILDDLSWFVLITIILLLLITCHCYSLCPNGLVVSSRFIINVPEEERQNLIRICFQIELAHWFYIDFYCDEHNLKPYGINQFALHMFRVIVLLKIFSFYKYYIN